MTATEPADRYPESCLVWTSNLPCATTTGSPCPAGACPDPRDLGHDDGGFAAASTRLLETLERHAGKRDTP